MYRAKFLSPMIPSYDIKKTASFFMSILNFKVRRHEENYAILEKDNLTIHILQAGTNIGEMEFYFEVNDIEIVWNNMKDKIDGLKFKAPFNQDYGMREVHIIIPETKTLMFIGQAIAV